MTWLKCCWCYFFLYYNKNVKIEADTTGWNLFVLPVFIDNMTAAPMNISYYLLLSACLVICENCAFGMTGECSDHFCHMHCIDVIVCIVCRWLSWCTRCWYGRYGWHGRYGRHGWIGQFGITIPRSRTSSGFPGISVCIYFTEASWL